MSFIFEFHFFQLWRLVTTFLFFGTFGFNFIFNMIFTYRYCRMLEENSFRGRSADFLMMFIFGSLCMIVCAFFVNLLFLGKIINRQSSVKTLYKTVYKHLLVVNIKTKRKDYSFTYLAKHRKSHLCLINDDYGTGMHVTERSRSIKPVL